MNLKSSVSVLLLLIAFSALPARAYSVQCYLRLHDPQDFSAPSPVGICRMTYSPSEVQDPVPKGAFDAGGECSGPGNRDQGIAEAYPPWPGMPTVYKIDYSVVKPASGSRCRIWAVGWIGKEEEGQQAELSYTIR